MVEKDGKKSIKLCIFLNYLLLIIKQMLLNPLLNIEIHPLEMSNNSLPRGDKFYIR